MSTWKIWLLGIGATAVGLLVMALLTVATVLSTAFLIGGGVSLIIIYLSIEKSNKKKGEDPYKDDYWNNVNDNSWTDKHE